VNNKKFIIYNNTKSFDDYEVFSYIDDVLNKGLISGNDSLYCYASSYIFEKKKLHIEMIKEKYGYKILVYEENRVKGE